MENFLGWTDKQIEKLVNDLYNGVVSREVLPENLYLAILERLTQGIIEGFGEFAEDSLASALYADFAANLSVFSAAKTFQQVNDMSNFLFDAEGNKRALSEFKKTADEIFDVYNNAWLETEYNTSISLAQSARDWLDIEENKEALPLLRYSTVGDERVREDHEELDQIIRPVDDAFWDSYYPPNDWNCRCIVEQLEEGEITDLKGKKLDKPPKLFNSNAAKTRVIFDEKAHPYLKVEDRYKKLKNDNFGL